MRPSAVYFPSINTGKAAWGRDQPGFNSPRLLAASTHHKYEQFLSMWDFGPTSRSSRGAARAEQGKVQLSQQGTGQSETLSPWKSKQAGTARALPGASSPRGFAFQGSHAAAGADTRAKTGSSVMPGRRSTSPPSLAEPRMEIETHHATKA